MVNKRDAFGGLLADLTHTHPGSSLQSIGVCMCVCQKLSVLREFTRYILVKIASTGTQVFLSGIDTSQSRIEDFLSNFLDLPRPLKIEAPFKTCDILQRSSYPCFGASFQKQQGPDKEI